MRRTVVGSRVLWLLTVGACGLALATLSSGASSTSSAAGGDLTFLACIGAVGTPSQGCGSSANLNFAQAVVVAPDGQNVYAGATSSNAIETFARAGDGTLTPAGCLGDS